MPIANIKDILITIVRLRAIIRLFNHVRFSITNDELLKACIKVLTPLVAKNKADKKPTDSKEPF